MIKEYSENELREKLSNVDFEANMPPRKECPECNGTCGRYGLAPHSHEFVENRVFTDMKKKPDWPKNFIEIEPGEGIYKCEKCGGNGWI